jgi:hypothetical protein
MKTKFFVALMLVAVLSLTLVGNVPKALADSNALNFESYIVGNINGQDGWSSLGAAGSGCAVYDHAVVDNIYGYASFGAKSLRISNAVTSGCFGDQTFAKPLVNAVGEISATAGTFSVGTRQTRFEMQFDIASTQPAQQPGMYFSVSPDRGDGSRMSYLRFEDGVSGIDVFFDDTPGPTNPANFNETLVATGLSRTVPHTVKLIMDVVDGPSNDIVKVYIDGALVHTGTSWENYYHYDSEASPEQSPRIVKTVIFRTGGSATPANSGKGFLIDNLTTFSGPTPAGTSILPATDTPTFCTGETSKVKINLNNIANLYGYQFVVNYDATKVSATGAFNNSFFDTTGDYAPWNATCSAGTCKFSVSKLAPQIPVTGSGTVAEVTFTGLSAGEFDVTVSNDILSDRDANAIGHAVGGPVHMTVCGLATVSGVVSLQGRATPINSGTVTLTNGTFGPYSTNFDPTTGAWSISNIKVLPGGTNYTFDAAHGLYLGNRMTQVLTTGSNTTSSTKLLGGDADNSGKIDLSDITCISGSFGGAPVTCGTTGSSDINADGTVNILDLVLPGGNYDLSTPQGW